MHLRSSVLVVHGAALALAGLVLLSAAQPLFTEDTWLHLALGESYAAHGPWLDADPLLHTAEGPPAPSAWLAGVALHGVERALGFQGLRVLHAALVAAALALAWAALRRASGSRIAASLGTAVFIVLAAYRLFQLRPSLLTIVATLLLVHLLLLGGDVPSWRRVAAATGLLALWANLHAGFVLGLALIAAALSGVVLAAALRPADRAGLRPRARRLAAALALAGLASLLNPEGIETHLLYLEAGSDTPELDVVADEWAPFPLLEGPTPRLPPSPLAWLAAWALLLGTSALFAWHARRRLREPGRTAPVDLPWVAIAGLGAAGMLLATRFLWLGVLPLLALAGAARALGLPAEPRRSLARSTAALAAVLLAGAFVRVGDWPMISRGVVRAGWSQPWASGKIDAHAVWFMADAGLEGRLFNDYAEGNLLGYWLAPRLSAFVNGSLNLPREAMEARRAVVLGDVASVDGGLTGLLDGYGVDVFFGTGLPVAPLGTRTPTPTTTHLEASEGWLRVFRSARSAIYLRDAPRNRANRERVARYYAAARIPFDPARGFDPAEAIRAAPGWAVAHGLVPAGFAGLERAAHGFDPAARRSAQGRLATVLALLGLYDRAIASDGRRLRTEPDALGPARRLVFAQLHRRRPAEALEAADRLAAVAGEADALSRFLVEAARAFPALPERERDALLARLPLLSPAEVPRALAGFQPGEARSPRR